MMSQKLYIFDFDDTLVSSGALIKIADEGGEIVRTMTSEEYANPNHPNQLSSKERKSGFREDFSEFEIYPPDGNVIEPTFSEFLRAIADVGVEHVVVLTARDSRGPVADFLSNEGVTGIEVITVAGVNPQLKASYVKKRLEDPNNDYSEVHVYEDSARNLNAIQRAVAGIEGVNFTPTHVTKQNESLLRTLIREMIYIEDI